MSDRTKKIKHFIFSSIILLGIFCNANYTHAQNTDSLRQYQDTSAIKVTINPPKFHSPKKASILSAMLPGAGQVYNKKYWKLPLVYGAMGTSAYFALKNSKDLTEAKNAYLFRLDSTQGSPSVKFSNVSRTGIDQIRRNRDWSYVFLGLSYILNIVDAAVDAHLFYFDVKEDVSLEVHPYSSFSTQPTTGVSLVLTF